MSNKALNQELFNLVERLTNPMVSEMSVLTWGCPVISFGNLSSSKIATLGLNPSNREFVDTNGNELIGENRRFHTLNSLGLNEWSEIEERHLNLILDVCQQYFSRNPYDGWFKRLDYIISGTLKSYYSPSGEACHLDLIPYATASKWMDLSNEQRKLLLELSDNTLGLLLKNSPVELLVLNGRTVVENLERIANIQLEKRLMPSWTLPRKDSDGVSGYSYVGIIDNISGVQLNREILVLGYNHNIQSSYGVTTKVQKAIRNWISTKSANFIS